MVRTIELNGKDYEVNIGMAVFSSFLDKSGATAEDLASGNLKFLMKEIFDIFAMGVRDAARLKGKKKNIKWEDIADIVDQDDSAFAKIQELVTEELGMVSEKLGGKSQDSGKS